jgi:hypothetical protein
MPQGLKPTFLDDRDVRAKALTYSPDLPNCSHIGARAGAQPLTYQTQRDEFFLQHPRGSILESVVN